MRNLIELRRDIEAGGLDKRIEEVYGCGADGLSEVRERLLSLTEAFARRFGDSRQVGIFSGPGRTELGGNHTDHQHGCVLAAAVESDTLLCAALNGRDEICIESVGYPPVRVELSDLQPREDERESSAALVRGIAARIRELGYELRGFDACVSSCVPGGSGLSSSAAYEVAVAGAVNGLCCGGALDPVQVALIGQYAENVYFGKPSGLMDQLTSSVGCVVSIDFRVPERPVVRQVPWIMEQSGYCLCIVDSGASHADLTAEYAAIPGEMCAVAAQFGKTVLRDVDEAEFRRRLPELRSAVGDRAVLRAIHFYDDNAMALAEAEALRSGDAEGFLALVRRSGESSALHLQNLSCWARPAEQAVPIAIAAAQGILKGRGAVRVHGGGFAGTIQVYVPAEQREEFRMGMEAVLGKGCCHFLHPRPEGGATLA